MKYILFRMLPVLIAGSIFFNLSANAQPAWTIFNDGNSQLPQNTIRCLAVDAQNRKWIGTDLGLVVYNDTNWTIYTTANTSGGLTDNSIRSITFDATGNVWLGTFQGGACRFDGTNWTSYTVANSGLPDDFVKGIAFDTANTPWFATAGGLAHFDGSNWQVWDMSNSALLSININCIVIGNSNIKYFGTQNGGMVYFDGDTTWEFYNHVNMLLPDNNVLSIALDNVGTRWIAMPAQGLYAHPDAGPPGWWDISTSTIPSNAITHVMVDAAQKKYLGSQDAGFIIFDGSTFVNYKMSNSPMPDNYVLCTIKDENGILWVGTYNGGLVRVNELMLTVAETEKQISTFNIYPNPATNQFTIYDLQFTIESIEVFDVTGQRVLQVQASDFKPQSPIDISSLTPGIYFLRIYSEQGTFTGKFVKAN